MALSIHLKKLSVFATTLYSHAGKTVHGSCALFSNHKQLPTLTLFTKDNCSLCDDAKEVLRKYGDRFVLEEVYITKPENRAYFKRYRYDIPVFHFNGEFLMKHRVDEELFKKVLAEYEQSAVD
ncbi:glutaredoxin-like protein C5orf63 homolog [Patiria miniata]|uniref:Glutaredoxin-like protein n=1 Tax=Patiria miniata TaxID=46514 RepID=A0A914B9A5_PATMI|nr:glutaredoxin-like protein C5orf63 homolog [Patiria miniata]XP_038072701.1 glutaredoxin-like protein C5orf63 homolog [Patiria miniata]